MSLLLEIAQLPRASFYYHLKQMKRADKYETAKAEITAIYHENKGRYGYRRIAEELRNRKIHLNHKTVQRLMKQLRLDGSLILSGKNGFEGYYGKMLRSHILPAHLLDVSFLTDETCFRPFGGQNRRCLWFSVPLWP